MAQFQNVMEVFQLLAKTNCRKCNAPTCLAFAASVYNGERQLSQCPFVKPEILQQYGQQEKRITHFEKNFQETLEIMTSKLKTINYQATAKRIGANFDGSKLSFKIMGKNFSVDPNGKIMTDIHTNPWITGPALSYIFRCKGVPVANRWVPLRELPNGKEWDRFFSQQCEKPLKKLADTYTELFEDLVQIFNGRQVENHYQSDVAVVLTPLPLIPMLICFWKPEEGMASDLNLFFDATAEENLGIEEIYALGTGIVRMFIKLAQRHGGRGVAGER